MNFKSSNKESTRKIDARYQNKVEVNGNHLKSRHEIRSGDREHMSMHVGQRILVLVLRQVDVPIHYWLAICKQETKQRVALVVPLQSVSTSIC